MELWQSEIGPLRGYRPMVSEPWFKPQRHLLYDRKTKRPPGSGLFHAMQIWLFGMALRSLAACHCLFEIGLFGNNLGMAFKTGLVFQLLALAVHYKIKAVQAFLFFQIVVAAGSCALLEIFLAVDLVVADDTFDF